MPQIFDHIEPALLPALKDTLDLSIDKDVFEDFLTILVLDACGKDVAPQIRMTFIRTRHSTRLLTTKEAI